MRKVRFQFTPTPNGAVGISSLYVQDLEINFAIDGSDESKRKIKQQLWEMFYTINSKNTAEEHKFPADGFQILGWSVYETKPIKYK